MVFVLQVDELPPVPGFDVQSEYMKRYSIGGEASVAPDVAFITIEEVAIEVGKVDANAIGLGEGGSESAPAAFVVPVAAGPKAVSI